MMLENAFDLGSDPDFLHRIAKQIAYHANIVRVRQLDQHRDVRAVALQRRVRGMPDPLPTEDFSAWFDFDPFRIEGMTAVTQPFRSELPCPTMAAALYE